MKKLYTLICAGLLITMTASAQSYSHTYTAVQSGNWQAQAGDPTIWTTGQPPVGVCDNCLIQLVIPGGGNVTMNTSISLNSGSTLVIGSGVTLTIAPSGATVFNDPTNLPHSIYLTDVQLNQITLVDATSHIVATGLDRNLSSPTGPFGYDGVFTTTQPSNGNFVLLKQVGGTPNQFFNNAITSNGPAVFGTSLTGPNTLNGFGALPIILTSFTATLDQDVVNLAWTTSSEINADHIAIQRSVDAGAHWATIGTEAAKNTTGTPTDYSFADNKPASGTSEYRLQLVDKDGKYTYSTVRAVRNGQIGAVSVYPNPASNYINVAIGGKATDNVLIRLYNQSGQLLQSRNVPNAGGTTVAFSVGGYPTGNYLVVINAPDGSKQVSNVLVSK